MVLRTSGKNHPEWEGICSPFNFRALYVGSIEKEFVKYYPLSLIAVK